MARKIKRIPWHKRSWTGKKRSKKAPKFNRWTKTTIYHGLRCGLPIVRACQLAEINASTYLKWMKLGMDKENRKYYLFRMKIRYLMGNREAETLQIIKDAAHGGQTVIERRITRGPRGREITTIKKKTPTNWKAARHYLSIVGGEVYSKRALEGELSSEHRKVDVHVSGSVEHEHGIVKKQMEAMRSLDVKDLEKIYCALTSINK